MRERWQARKTLKVFDPSNYKDGVAMNSDRKFCRVGFAGSTRSSVWDKINKGYFLYIHMVVSCKKLDDESLEFNKED